MRNTFLTNVKFKKNAALLAVFVLLFSFKGLVLCHEGGQDYVLEFKYSPCCYKAPAGKTSKPLLKTGNLKYQSDFCVDYDISVFSHIAQNNAKLVKYFVTLIMPLKVISKIFFTPSHLSLFFKRFYFVTLLNKIISSTVLLI